MAIVLGMLAGGWPLSPQAQDAEASPASALTQLLKPIRSVQPGQSATLLPDGRWLLLGGQNPQGTPVATALIFDSKSGQSAELPSRLLQARTGHSATLLADGTVLILGGISTAGTVLDSAERFDPASGTFETLPAIGLIARAQHTATLLSNGQLLIAGGVDGQGRPLYDVELYHTLTKQVESFNARLESARLNDLAALLPANVVLLWGGVDALGAPLSTAEIFDPVQLRFMPYSTANALALAASLEGPAAPAVMASEPSDAAQSVAVDVVLSVRFSKRLDVTSLNEQSVVLMGPTGAVAAKVTPVETGVLLFVTPARHLLPDSHYTLFVNEARDSVGQELPFTAIGFRTTALAGSTSPDANREPVQKDSTSRQSPTKEEKPAGEKEERRPTPAEIDEDDEWLPSGPNFTGDWRTGRARERAARTLPQRPELRRAIHGVDGGSAAPIPAGTTAVVGQVLLLNGRPLPNVALSIGEQRVQTDTNGEFVLRGIRSGGQTLVIDGGAASSGLRRYGRYEYRMHVREGQVNALPFVIWMTRLDTAHAIQIASPTRSETVVTTPRIPGLELRIPAGKVIRDAAGRIVTEVSITPIPVDQPPFPLPKNVPVPVYFTIQPGGAHLEDIGGNGAVGARLIYPNFSSAAPGARMDFWNYDSRDRGWYVYGHGSVSQNGRQTIPDPGVAIYEFTGAMIGGPGLAPSDWPPYGGCKSLDPIDCFTGLFLHYGVDLRINDVVPLELARTYRPKDIATRAFGIGTMLSYDVYLVGDTDPWSYQELILPDGGRIHYDRTSPGTHWTTAVYEHRSTPGQFNGSTIAWNGGGWTLRLKDGSGYRFPEAYQTTNFRKGAAIQVFDRVGNAVNLVRDANGNLTEIVSPNGRSIFLTYDASNRITQARDDTGRAVAYQYDASGRLESVTDPMSGVEQYTYDASYRMLTVRDKRNNVMVTNTYDANGRVATQTYPDGTTASMAYTLDGAGKVTQVDITDERGTARRMTFNASGYPLTITRAVGTPEQQVYTNNIDSTTNLLLSKTDALGRTTAFQYDAKGNMTQMTLLSGTPNAVSWTYTYDPVHNRVMTVTDPLNNTTTYQYDDLGNLISVTDPLNHVTQMIYTAAGQLASVTDALNHITNLWYTAGDLSSVTDPLGRTVSFTTDALGRVVFVTDPLGNRSTIAYDALDRVTSRADPLGQQVAFSYDPNSNMTSFTDARSNVTAFAYDSRNRLISKTNALLQVESYEYDEAGNLLFVTDRKGQVTGYTYDVLGRRTQAGFGATSTTSPVYESTITYTYDAADRVTQIADSVNGTITRQYDARFDTVAQEVTSQGTVDYSYDSAGRRTSMTPSAGTQVTYTYDAASRLTQITQGTSATGFAYNDVNRRTTLTLANGVTLAYTYDNANQLTGITYRDAASTLLGDLTYAYDIAGRRIAIGGSFSRSGLADAVASATYDANNRLTSWAGTALAHDANGNLLGSGGKTYTWNKRDQLTGITGTSSASFSYDALGRRQAKTVAGTARQFVYDGFNPIQEKSGSTVAASLLTGLRIDEYFARTEGTSTHHYLTDGLGSAIRLTDGAGAKIVDYTYEPYGETTADAALTNVFQYTSRESDGTGLYYYRARYYDPALKRFISEDPIGLKGGANLYAYVGGNPTQNVDPHGLMNYLVGGGVAGAVGIGGTPASAQIDIEGGAYYNSETGDFGGYSTTGMDAGGANGPYGGFYGGFGGTLGFIPGGPENVSGTLQNLNVGFPFLPALGLVVYIDPNKGKFAGGGLTVGPSIGGGMTRTDTRTFPWGGGSSAEPGSGGSGGGSGGGGGASGRGGGGNGGVSGGTNGGVPGFPGGGRSSRGPSRLICWP